MSRRSGRAQRTKAARRGGSRTIRTGGIDALGVALLAATAVLLPLSFDPAAELPFPIVKAAVLQIAAYAIGAVVVLKVLSAGLSVIPRTWLLLPVAAFLVTLILAAVLSVHVPTALWGAYDRRLGLAASLELAVVFLAAVIFARDPHHTAAVLLAAALGGALAFAYAVAQRLGLDPVRWGAESVPVFSTFGNSNIMGHYFAVLAATAAAAVLAQFPHKRPGRAAVVLAALCAAFVAGTVLSGARSALLGLGAGMAVALAMWSWKLWMHRRARLVGAIAGIGVSAIALGLLLLTPVGPRIASLAQGTDLSVSERSLLYQTITQIVADRPLLGVGPDNLAAVYNTYRPVAALPFGTLVTQSSAHGWPWRAALDAGLCGLVAFVAIPVSLASAAVGLFRQGDWRGPVLVSALFTYLAAGLFAVNDLGTDWMFWLVAGLLVAATIQNAIPRPSSLRGWRVGLALVLAVGMLWPITSMAYDTGSSRALRASRSLASRDIPVALQQARRAVEEDSRWPPIWNWLGLRALDAGDRELALKAFTRAAEIGGYDPLIWTNLGKLQAQLARQRPALSDGARSSASRAAAADPRNPVVRAGTAQIYLLLGDGESAAQEAEVALTIMPGNGTYLELAANGYLQAGQGAEARKAALSALALGETWQLRYLLARAYVLEGRNADARTELRRVLELNAGNQLATALLAQLGP